MEGISILSFAAVVFPLVARLLLEFGAWLSAANASKRRVTGVATQG